MGQQGAADGVGGLNRVPVYRQLQQIFLDRITSGLWKPNHALPNELHLANQYGVSVGTIRKVVDELAGLGLVTRKQGRGTFVNDSADRVTQTIFDPVRNADGSVVRWDVPRMKVGYGVADQEESRLLNRPASQAEVARLSWLYMTNGRPLVFQQTIVPVDIGFDKLRVPHLTGLAELYAQLGIIVERSEERLSVAMPDVPIKKALGVAGSAVLQRAQCRFFDDRGAIVGASHTWLNLETEHYACGRSVRNVYESVPWLLMCVCSWPFGAIVARGLAECI